MEYKHCQAAAPALFALSLSIFAVVGWSSTASAQSNPDTGPRRSDGLMIPDDPKEIVEKSLGTATKLNLLTAKAFSLAKAAIAGDPFAVVNALIDLLASDSNVAPDITVLQAKTEIINKLNADREDSFVGRSQGLLGVFAQLIADPKNMLNDNRLAGYLNDATYLQQEIQTILVKNDPALAETKAHLAAVYNTVTSSLIIGLSMGNYNAQAIEGVYVDAINTNSALVSDDDNYGGYLYNYIVGLYGHYWCTDGIDAGQPVCYDCSWSSTDGVFYASPTGGLGVCGQLGCDGQTEERTRIDHDPTIYMIRRTVTDQELALF